MKDQDKTKQTLIDELAFLRKRIAELEQSEPERKQTEEKLKTAEETYRNIFMNSQTGLFRTEISTGLMTEANDSMARFAGFKNREELLSSHFNIAERYMDPEARKKMLAIIKKQGHCDNYETLFRRNDGSAIWIRLSVRLVPDKEWLEGVAEDITQIKNAQDALRESEELYTRLINTIPDVIIRTDLDGKILFVNDNALKFNGYHHEEVLGRNMMDFIASEDQSRAIQNTLFMMEGRMGSQEYRLIMKDGTAIPFEINGDVLKNEDGTPFGFVHVCRDISDRKRAETTLQESKDQYRMLFENAGEAIFVAQDDKLAFFNPMTTMILGYTEEELSSRPFVDFIHKNERDMVKNRYVRRLRGEYIPRRYSFRVIQQKGELRWVELDTVHWKGKPATLNFMIDITSRKEAEAEKKRLEERLRRAEKMEALGQLAGGVAHDLNNVLGVLSGYSELLLAEIPEGQKSRKYAEKILQSTEKGATIIQDLLTLARRGVMLVEVIQFNDIVSGFTNTPAFESIKDYHPGVSFLVECDPNLQNIKGSPVHLEKTLMNLLCNAAEAIIGEGEVTIRTENRYLDKAIMGHDEVREGDYAVLTVSDTGTGIAGENQEKIFEPFYTKKAMGRSGTGLGLSIVWGTVKDHNGYIDVQSRLGEGTTFTLYFPATRDERIAPPQRTPVEQYMSRGETVLVVDDIAEQRDVASGLLRKLGYRVHSVSSGEEAVEYLRENRADMVILDMIMAPGMDGMETYRRVLEINPKQKAILVSGFSETDRVLKAQMLGAGVYVKKPYVMETIGLAIRKELER